MNKIKKAVIVHGAYGGPYENWNPWLAGKLRENGVNVWAPKLPTPDGQSLSNWLREFEVQVGGFDQNSILIGHSTGAAFILNLLERSENKALGAFFVSGFCNELGLEKFDPLNSSFVEKSFGWESIKTSADKFYVYHSDNDPYVPEEEGKKIAESLDATFNIISDGGHLNEEAGYTKFPQLLKDIKAIA